MVPSTMFSLISTKKAWRIFRAVKLLRISLQLWGQYAFVQTHRMHNTKSKTYLKKKKEITEEEEGRESNTRVDMTKVCYMNLSMSP